MLKARYLGQPPEALVFPSPKDRHIDDHNFRNRAWNKVVTDAGVKYRHPYTCRHTFISHALSVGVEPVKVAELRP